MLWSAFVLFALPPTLADAGVLSADTVWEGEVLLSEDLVVPEGITLLIRPGTVIRVAAAESTKTDPEYLSSLTELTVRGALKAEGSRQAPIVFMISGEAAPGLWAGILIDGGAGSFAWCSVRDAEAGMTVLNGALRAEHVSLEGNHYGLVAQGVKTDASVAASTLAGNDYGLLTLNGARPRIVTSEVRRNRKKDRHTVPDPERPGPPSYGTVDAKGGPAKRYGDDVLPGETVWSGRIEIGGIVRVPAGSRLVVLPGTIIEFMKKDTNRDGIGENGFLIQGVLIAKGTAARPIVFRSAEKARRPGDWDAINIMNSDGAQNLVEHCRIEDAYRGLHFHFSNVAVKESVFAGNYRGIQFQESFAEIMGSRFAGNRSAVQARDSEAAFTGNTVQHNYSGVSFFRSSLVLRGNRIAGNFREGLRVREGAPLIERNLIDGNRFGMMLLDAVYGSFRDNVVANNAENGLSVKGADNLEISGNFLCQNGLSGLDLQDSRAVVSRNLISDNGLRGVGLLTFEGTLTGNALAANGGFAVEVEGDSDASAPGNWWGGGAYGGVVLDREDDASRGRLHAEPVLGGPPVLSWPLDAVGTGITWRGAVSLRTRTTVSTGMTLTIAPGSSVLFAEGAGLSVKGSVTALGNRDERIVFTSLETSGTGRWDEIFLDHARGSVFSHCDFEYATWAIHSHFTDLRVTDCRFRKNSGGIRFRSGPVEIRRSLFEGNGIGLRAFRAKAVIAENVITKNETGIFVREKGAGLSIGGNNIFGNEGYNIRNGDFNDEDVDARDNWWGEGDPSAGIFDGRSESGIGLVLYEPFRREPVQ